MKIEINDLRAAITLLNVVLVLCLGSSFAILGALLAVGGLIKDFTTDRKANGFILHGANLIMYIVLLFR